MSGRKALGISVLRLLMITSLIPVSLFAYNGSKTWLYYTPVSDPTLKAQYQSVCKSLVLSDENSDTLKNAKEEFDLAIPELLGGSKLSSTDGPGAIVLAPEGSSLLAEGIDFSKVTEEGFIIKSIGDKTYITSKSQVGILRGAFYFIRLMQTGKPVNNLNIVENPYFPLRVLDHWYNHYGSRPDTERVYGGNRVYRMENFGKLSEAELKRIKDYCRMAASLGLNGICPDNVNTYRGGSIGNYKCLEEANLKTQKVFADIIGTYGLKYYLSVSYASPRLVTPRISTANAHANAQAKQWWFEKVDMVRKYIANFGGFLMKADSEGEEGPRGTYGLNQSQGANPMAEALKRYGYNLIWRTFVYNNTDDFAISQWKEFEGQTWDEAVILRTKDGPRDFQVMEPPNPLLGMKGVRHGMEFQITQEYTGQSIHLCWLVPKWRQILHWDLKGAPLNEGTEGSITYQILRGTGDPVKGGGGVWGISNLSDTVNWTAQFLAQANYYGFGRLAWNPLLTEEQIADEWIRCSFYGGSTPEVRFVVNDMLSKSWRTYEDYTISYSALMPALRWNDHYEIDFDGMRLSEWYTPYFMNLTNDGIGVDRTPTTGNNFVQYYPRAVADSFANIEKCPEDFLLFFHHCKWEYKMKSGMTLIQSLYHNHFRGLHQVRNFINNWKMLADLVDSEIHKHVLAKLNHQYTDAKRWVEDFKSDFGSKYKESVGCNLTLITPDTNKATVVEAGASVNLSAKFTDQKNAAINETLKWSVDNGGTLNATEGSSVSFSAEKDGIYTVTVSTAKFPDLKDKVQIFVGNWAQATGTRKTAKSNIAKPSMQILRNPYGISIITSSAGKIDIFGLQGKVIKSINLSNVGTCFVDTRDIANGLYLLRLQSGTQSLHEKLILR